MLAVIPDAIRPRLGQFVRLLGSDHPGEVVAAAAALRRALAGVGADLHDLAGTIEQPAVVLRAAPQPASRQPRKPRQAAPGSVELDFAGRMAVAAALRRGLAGGRMSEWEREFSTSLVARLQAGRGCISEKQGDALGRLLHRLREGAAWA